MSNLGAGWREVVSLLEVPLVLTPELGKLVQKVVSRHHYLLGEPSAMLIVVFSTMQLNIQSFLGLEDFLSGESYFFF